MKEFENEQIKVIAGSIDPIEKTREIIEKIGIGYPVACGLDAEEVSRVTGVYFEKERRIIQPAGFLIRPDKTVEIACYSSGPIGRFVAGDVLKLVRFYKSRM
jgi:peroxiredoxin